MREAEGIRDRQGIDAGAGGAAVTTAALVLALVLAVAAIAVGWLLTGPPEDRQHLTLLAAALVSLAALAGIALWRVRSTHARLVEAVTHLADSDARYRALAAESEALRGLLVDAVDSIDEGFVLFDRDARLVVCNDRYRRAYPAIADLLEPGVRFEDILATAAERMGMTDGPQGRDLQHWVHSRMQRHLEAKDFTECQLSDGHWYRISERPTRSGGIVKVLMDITAAKTHERDLAHKNDLLETVFDSMSQGLAVFDDTEHLVAWNERFARVMDYPAALLKGSATADDFRAFDADRRVAALPASGLCADLRAGPESVLPDGRSVETAVNPMPRGGFVATFTDTTARRQAELALQHHQKMDAIGQLAGGIAHEFNNMLTSIGGFARMALRTPEDSGRVVMCLNEVTKAADRAACLTGQLLNFSRRTADEEVRPLRLKDLLKDLTGFLHPLLGERVSVRLEVDAPDLMVNADAARLHQAVVNLCINARDAMPEGGEITLRLARHVPDSAFAERHPSVVPGPLAAIEVVDTGCGIDEVILDRIYEPFFTTKEQGKGTGLGLPQVYSTAEHLGGAVEVVSEVGRGSTFTIFLPLLDDGVTTEAGAAAGVRVSGEGITLLLAEDEDSVRRYLTLTLEDAGFTVLTATNGAEALAIYRDAGDVVDGIITDVVMPVMEGPELARAVLADTPDLPILFLSGYSAEDSWHSLAEGPHRALLPKPVQAARLFDVLASLLDLTPVPTP